MMTSIHTSLPPEINNAREHRLYEIRRQAEQTGKVISKHDSPPSIESIGASAENGYYRTPLLKRPQWTVEVPIYFFVGGMAGASSLIAAAGQLSSADVKLVRHARWLAAIGGLVSPALLIADLGVPSRFLNMLRVLKIQSPMSVGSWTLVAFSNTAAATAVLDQFQKRRASRSIAILKDAAQVASAITGLILSTYTGVLVGATAIPVWNEHAASLPIHFAASGVAAAAGMLELTGNESEALNKLAIGAAAIESAMGAAIEMNRTPAAEDLKTGVSGWAMRGAGALSGPIPLALRLLAHKGNRHRSRLRRSAAVCSLVGSLLTRWAWVQAGKQSADNPDIPLKLESR